MCPKMSKLFTIWPLYKEKKVNSSNRSPSSRKITFANKGEELVESV